MLIRTKDRKVTNAITPSGNPAIANSFGLPSGKEFSCPGMTPFCESICYAGRLEKMYKNVRNVLMHNWNLLKDATLAEMRVLLDDMITDFEKDCDKRGAEKHFRIHWDGDFFNYTYTLAWWEVMSKHPNVNFWVYTRSAEAALFLHYAEIPNLTLYFSSDPDNVLVANAIQEYGILIAHVDTTFAKGKAEFPKATKCPENTRAIPLISEKGSACMVCKLCVVGRKDVLFSASKS